MQVASIVFIGILLSYWTTQGVSLLEPGANCSPRERWSIALLAGLLFSVLCGLEPPTFQLLVTLGVVQCLLLIGFIDLKTQNIPDLLNAVLGTGGLLILLAEHGLSMGQGFMAITGAVLGGGLLFAVAIVTRGAIGGGDIKLAFGLGFLLGPGHVVILLLTSFVLAAGYAGIQLMTHKKGLKDFIPLGPSLVVAAIGVLIYEASGFVGAGWPF